MPEDAQTLISNKKFKNTTSWMSHIKSPWKNGVSKNFDELSLEQLQEFKDDHGHALVRELIKNPSEMIIIGTDVNRNRLGEASVWGIDGTFKAGCYFTHSLLFSQCQCILCLCKLSQ